MEEMNAEEQKEDLYETKTRISRDIFKGTDNEFLLRSDAIGQVMDCMLEFHAQQSKGMYTEEEVAEAAFNSWTECYKQNRRTDAPYDKAARLYSNQTFEEYWESIKPKK
mgnify:CR=1 FL=1